QLMLAVAGAVFPRLPEIKRTLSTRCCPCCQQAMHFMGIHRRQLGNGRPTNFMITA
ncbi:IS91 family transposase, partial [Shewanella surugensis]|nr:IS91 family transposase [Shewanella surugensis]